MAIAFVQNMAAAPTTQTTATTTLTFTTSVTGGTGNQLVVAAIAGRSTVPTTCTFSGGGLTWTTDQFGTRAASVIACAVGSAPMPSGLASGSVITATWDQSTTRRAMMILEFSGVGAKDGTLSQQSNNASGTNTTGAAIGPTSNGDTLAVACWDLLTSAAGVSGTAGTQTGTATGGTVTEFMDVEVQSTTGCLAYAEYVILTGVGTVSLNYTPTTNAVNCSALVCYAPAATAVVTPSRPTIVLQAVNRASTW